MRSWVRPELPTASVGSSQAPTAAVDNSAPSAIRPVSTYKSGNVVQTNGATSDAEMPMMASLSLPRSLRAFCVNKKTSIAGVAGKG